MFDVGFSELLLISVIGLLVLGPQRLPKVAAEIGKWVGRARRTATQLRRQLEREIELEDLERLRTRSPPPPDAGPNPPPASPAPGTPDTASTSDVAAASDVAGTDAGSAGIPEPVGTADGQTEAPNKPSQN